MTMINSYRFSGSIFFISLFLYIISCYPYKNTDSLKNGFLNPPDSARPGVYWYFMDGNIDRKAMTADLESMKEAGLGYVVFLEVNVGVPRGNVNFLSDEWQDLYRHAVKESERLGIRIILGSGPGWAGSGGPWVQPGQSMIHIVASDTIITGPSDFKSRLSVPEPMKPFFGENSLTPELKKIRDKWFEDVCVLAFPADEQPEKIDGIEEKALYYRAPFTSQPGVLPYLPEPFKENEPAGRFIDPDKVVNLTDKIQKSGILTWNVPPGTWHILRFVKRNNGAVTRPAPLPGLGFECDKLDTAAFDAHYEAYVGKLIKKALPKKSSSEGGWTMIHIDSWESGSQNWTSAFREEFIRRRGYDPLPYLPVFKGFAVSSKEISERFLWDIRQTAGELLIDNHALRFKNLGRKEGFRLSLEPYDMNPAADLDLGSTADVPMCEFWSDGYGFNSAFSCIEATSIAHVKGAPVVAAEAFTAAGNEAWKKYPADMKNQGDWAFCMGINRFMYHTFAHKPYGDHLKPGMTMGPYGVHWDRGQTWWPMVKEYHRYIARCQYLLSQGKPVSDVLYLAGEGAPHVFRPPSTALAGTPVMPDKKGYQFDGCSPVFLINNAFVKDGLISFPVGASYRLLILPEVRMMTPQLLKKIKELVKDGATVIGNPPLRSPSLEGFPGCDDQIRDITKELWGNAEMPEELTRIGYGSGSVWWGKQVANPHRGIKNHPDSLSLYSDYSIVENLLRKTGLDPDFESSGKLRYTHRSLPDREIYFISNKTDSALREKCFFRKGTERSELWDPVTGEFRNLKSVPEGKRIYIDLKLDPYQSYFVIFYKSDRLLDKSKSVKNNFPDKHVMMEVNGQWIVTFDTIWGGPDSIKFEDLSDWSKSKVDGIRFYSGIAEYSKRFYLEDSLINRKKADYYIDLGIVKNIASVNLNGNNMGIIWTSPWQVKVTDAIQSGENIVRIKVANLWINRLIGDEYEPWDGIENGQWPGWLIKGTRRPTKRYAFATCRPYSKNDRLVESGLIGPVMILKSDRVP